MKVINEYIVVLVATLMFMTATELISPDNSMKKYLKFVLGLIFISVLITPIIKFFSGGEEVIIESLEKFQTEIESVELTSTSTKNSDEARKNSFIKNYNNECEKLLENKFDNMNFICDLDCNVDFKEMTFSVNKLTVKVNNNNIKDVKNVNIAEGAVKEESKIDVEIKNYINKELEINKDKIEVINS